MAALGAVLSVARSASASVTVLIGEPFGNFGTMMPVGHTAVYLDHLCADGPLKIRQCQTGETPGVVLARYFQLGSTDWIATPAMQFFYATDRLDEIPEYATAENVMALRQAYRKRYLSAIVPDIAVHDKQLSEWWETAGMAYNRRVWGYQLDSTPEQDQALLEKMNEDENRHHYTLRKNNCANFVADVVNLYYPGLVRHGDRVADFGLMTPKQVARSVAAYGLVHPELHPRVIEIAQVAGSLRRSRPVRGGAEAGLKTKRYLATLLVLQPEIPATLAILYLAHGRWQVGKGAEVIGPEWLEGETPGVVATR